MAYNPDPSFPYCGWLIEVASGNPEPDCYEDTIRIVECGADIEVNEHGSWRCSAGHEHVSFADPARAEHDHEAWVAERMEAMQSA